jgi:FkbM family methyltransferase
LGTDGREDLRHRLQEFYLRHAPERLVRLTAQVLARSKPLAPYPGWHFDPGADDTSALTEFRRELWQYFSDHDIDEPLTLRWIDGLRVRTYLGNDMSLCLFVGGSFEPNEFCLMRHVLHSGMVAIDGGANDGLYSLFASRLVAPGGRVVAVEPSSREFSRLEANLRLNAAANVTALRLALGQAPGQARLAVAEAGHEGQNTIGEHVSNPKVETARHEDVEVDTIDRLVGQLGLERVDWVKLDVEGSEVAALRGGIETIQRYAPLVQVEVEAERLASQGMTKTDVVELLTELGYGLFVFDPTTGRLREAAIPDEPEGNALAAPHGWSPPDAVRSAQ